MDTMNCLEVRYRLLRFLFGELSLVELAELNAHMDVCEGCGDCQVEKESVELILKQMASTTSRQDPSPEGMRERILARVKLEDIEGEPS
jgi:hypothetical protein